MRKFAAVGRALQAEETAERERHRQYWQYWLPLRAEFEKLRHGI